MINLIPLLILIIYLAGVILFATGYRHTTFGKTIGKRLLLSLLWPAFMASNARYRRNFRRALKRNSDPW